VRGLNPGDEKEKAVPWVKRKGANLRTGSSNFSAAPVDWGGAGAYVEKYTAGFLEGPTRRKHAEKAFAWKKRLNPRIRSKGC